MTNFVQKRRTTNFALDRLAVAIIGLLFVSLLSALLPADSWASIPRAVLNLKEAHSPNSAKSGEAGNYIVVYRDEISLASRLNIVRSRGIEVERTYRNVFKGVSVKLSEKDLRWFNRDDAVLIVEPDRTVTTQQSRPQDRSPVGSWGVDRIDQRTRALDNRFATAGNGYGVEAYVIDTGIRSDHTEFTGRINSRGFTSVYDGMGWEDCNGHGTHVAGTVAGSTFGVAPETRLTAVRVLDCEGTGRSSGVIAGIDWMAGDHPEGVAAVANLSLGGPESEAVNLAVQEAVADGITVVVAAGNDSQDACESSPASAPEAVTVGSIGMDDSVSGFSNVGPCVDIFAPGSEIKSAGHGSPSGTRIASGTSMASPHVAGAAALLLSRYPNLSPEAVTERLMASSTPGTPGDERVDPGCLLKRVLYVGSEPDQPDPPPPPRPANDNFADAEVLSGSTFTTDPVSSLCASAETGEPGHGANPGSWRANTTVWFRWTAPSSGTLILNPLGHIGIRLLSAYIGQSVDQLKLVGRNRWESFWSLYQRAEIPVISGVTYSIAVDAYDGRSSDFRLSGDLISGQPNTELTAPANDNFSNAMVLGSATNPNSGPIDLGGATSQVGEPNHTRLDDRPIRFTSVWFRWTAPANGVLAIDGIKGWDGQLGSRFLGAYQGSSVDSLVTVAPPADCWEDDYSCRTGTRRELKVREGQTYSFAIGTNWVGFVQEEDFSDRVSFSGVFEEGPPNDDFTEAERIKLTQTGSDIEGNLNRATVETGEPLHDLTNVDYPSDPTNPFRKGPHSSVWFKWTAPVRGVATVRNTTYDYWLDLGVYDGSSVESLRSITTGNDVAVFRTKPGKTYFLAVDADRYGEEAGFFLDLGMKLFPPKIVSKPKNNTLSRTARFRFAGDLGTQLECRLAGEWYWKKCNRITTFRGLKPGARGVAVRQTYGSITSRPVFYYWVIRGKNW